MTTKNKTSKEKYGSEKSIDVTFVLKNTGKIDADEVAQLYIHRVDAKVEWPFKELMLGTSSSDIRLTKKLKI